MKPVCRRYYLAKTIKIAISLPEKEFKEIETFKKKEKTTRSKVILEAIRYWKESKKMNKLVKTYKKNSSRSFIRHSIWSS